MGFLFLACDRGPQVEIVAPDGAEKARVAVEIAKTPSQREVGLMYRDSLGENSGMIFLFPDQKPLKFWMRNTRIPLDMIFADHDGRVVGIVENAEPFSERPVGPDAPSQFVLEVNGGFAARHSITLGSRFDFSGFSPQTSN
ncbi:MAG TPA: DUF192 domain-containing protein [Candidatus Binataceae bacterium]|nr:DUF192 domain-containing protein [Candidatus Binataceae bacterium]